MDAARMWEYTVLVTDSTYPLETIAQLYRDRCDGENGFDELKNQWGLSGFTTQDLARSQTTARAGALIYNWWSWYCRAAHLPGTARNEKNRINTKFYAGFGINRYYLKLILGGERGIRTNEIAFVCKASRRMLSKSCHFVLSL